MEKEKRVYDEGFLAAFRNGDEAGLSYFFKSLYPALCVFAGKYVADSLTAEAIVSDSFLKVWDKRKQFTDEAGLRSYLYRCVYTGCLKHLKKMLRQAQHDKEAASSEWGVVSDENLYMANITSTETLRMLYAGIEGLPAECGKIIRKLYVEGLSVKETAAELNLAISTIHAQKDKGVRLLRLRLKDGLWLLVAGCWLLIAG